MASQRRITLRKEASDQWHFGPESWEIRFRDETVGRVTHTEKGYEIVLRTLKKKPEESDNPNCIWEWKPYRTCTTFCTLKVLLKADNEMLKDRFDKLLTAEEAHYGKSKAN